MNFNREPNSTAALLRDLQTPAMTRRKFLKRSLLFATAVGTTVPFMDRWPLEILPTARAQSAESLAIPGKDGLIVLNDRPLNAEPPAHLLDDSITPAARFFVRNNGIVPQADQVSAENWVLEVGGKACVAPQRFTIGDLQRKFTHHTYALQMECAGNGRKEFFPSARGNQWSVGAIGCARWTGVRLRDVLEDCGIRDNAVYVGYYGADKHLSGAIDRAAISRGIPMNKALEDESLIAWAMNDEEIPQLHGFPLRLVCGGWPASVSGKWLQRLVIRDRVHDGEKMQGHSYRVPCNPVAPGATVPEEDMCIIESLPVKSLITFPKSGESHPVRDPLNIRGHAWAGDVPVERMETSIDFGATWHAAALEAPVNRLAWQRWRQTIQLPRAGYYEIWARAVDSNGTAQPTVLPGWNPGGYLNNAAHRIAVQAV